jgi:hypothetical protein
MFAQHALLNYEIDYHYLARTSLNKQSIQTELPIRKGYLCKYFADSEIIFRSPTHVRPEFTLSLSYLPDLIFIASLSF